MVNNAVQRKIRKNEELMSTTVPQKNKLLDRNIRSNVNNSRNVLLNKTRNRMIQPNGTLNRPPQRAQQRPPQRAQQRPPQRTQQRPPQRTQQRPPQRAQQRPPQRAQQRPPQRAQRRPHAPAPPAPKPTYTNLKNIGVVYTFSYNEDDDDKKHAFNNLSFFIKRTLNKAIWTDPNKTGINPFFIFILNSKTDGFVFPIFNNVSVIENFDKSVIDNASIFKNKFNIVTDKVMEINSSFSGPFIEPNQNTYWFNELTSLKIDELTPIFIKSSDATNKLIYDKLKWHDPSSENVEPIPGTNYAIYCHYDENNVVQDYVITQIKCLKKLGYNIVFYTTSESISNDNEIKKHIQNINYIQNISIGTEFYILNITLKRLRDENIKYDNILFVNDSVLFPVNGLANMRETINRMNIYDFWGHWDEYMPSMKIQFIYSCFLHFKQKTSADIILYLDEWLPKCTNRTEFINYIEWKLPNYIFNKKYSIGTVIPFKELKLRNVVYNNIYTHNPSVISKWLFKPETFGIKFKYILFFLNKNSTFLTSSFWYLTRYLYVGKNQINYYTKEKSGLYIKIKNEELQNNE